MEREVLVVGESLVDIVHAADGSTREYAGGSAANVAVALARLGRPVRFVTGVGRRRAGPGARRPPRRRRRRGSRADPHVLARTATAAATIGADGAASYEFDLEWRIGAGRGRPPPRGRAHLLARRGPRARRRGGRSRCVTELREVATISYDINARPGDHRHRPDLVARVERMVAVGRPGQGLATRTSSALYPDLEHRRCRRRLLTLGRWRSSSPAAPTARPGSPPTRTVEVASLPVEVADTIGAGDTFGAAIIDALWERGRLGAEHRTALGSLTAARSPRCCARGPARRP